MAPSQEVYWDWVQDNMDMLAACPLMTPWNDGLLVCYLDSVVAVVLLVHSLPG